MRIFALPIWNYVISVRLNLYLCLMFTVMAGFGSNQAAQGHGNDSDSTSTDATALRNTRFQSSSFTLMTQPPSKRVFVCCCTIYSDIRHWIWFFVQVSMGGII